MNDEILKIPVQKLNNDINLPQFAYIGDAGFDLLSSENADIEPNARKLIKCGISIAIPKGYAGLVIPRSGLALKHGITVLNSPGLVDSGYRGEICVVLLNTDNDKSFHVSIGDRIAQMMIVSYANSKLIECDKLNDTERSKKGFGSSGIN